MATSRRRTRTDSVQGAIESMRASQVRVAWPDTVPAHQDAQQHALEQRLFEDLIGERSALEWSPHGLTVCARAAQTQAMCLRLTAEINEEGPTVLGGKRGDVLVANPKVNVLVSMNSTLTTLLRQVGSATPGVDSRQLRNSAKAERIARSALDRARDPLLHGDDLLA